MKKANTDREILHILSNLRNFNGIFRKGVTCDDIKSHKKNKVSPSLSKIHFPKKHKVGEEG